MQLLFIHQNFPGQFLHIANCLSQNPGFQVFGIGENKNIEKRGTIQGITTVGYQTPTGAGANTHPYIKSTEAAIRRGQVTARALIQLKENGLAPDAIIAHPGWGEALFVRDIFPHTPMALLCEFFFNPREADMAFDSETAQSLEMQASTKIRNSTQVTSILEANLLLSPTQWQASRFPELFQKHIHVIHEGIDTDRITPNHNACITLEQQSNGDSLVLSDSEDTNGATGKGRIVTLRKGQKIITYIARNLEPYRGFHRFMRSLPAIQAKHPDAEILIVGGNEVSYSPHPPADTTYKEMYLEEVGHKLDFSRIHFTGRVPYHLLMAMYQISAVHVYLTYPFVLSWSLLELMAAEGLVVGSRTEPVEEVITHGINGILVDFFSEKELVSAVDEALTHPERFEQLRTEARKTILSRFQLQQCLEQQLTLFARLAQGEFPLIGS